MEFLQGYRGVRGGLRSAAPAASRAVPTHRPAAPGAARTRPPRQRPRSRMIGLSAPQRAKEWLSDPMCGSMITSGDRSVVGHRAAGPVRLVCCGASLRRPPSIRLGRQRSQRERQKVQKIAPLVAPTVIKDSAIMGASARSRVGAPESPFTSKSVYQRPILKGPRSTRPGSVDQELCTWSHPHRCMIRRTETDHVNPVPGLQ